MKKVIVSVVLFFSVLIVMGCEENPFFWGKAGQSFDCQLCPTPTPTPEPTPNPYCRADINMDGVTDWYDKELFKEWYEDCIEQEL